MSILRLQAKVANDKVHLKTYAHQAQFQIFNLVLLFYIWFPVI